MNGYARPPSRTGNGSVGNVTADLLKDIKAKDAELESTRKQLAWMREALCKAAKMGYVYAEKQDDMVVNVDAEDMSSRDTDLILKFKSFKAQIQVNHMHTLSANRLTIYLIVRHGRAS